MRLFIAIDLSDDARSAISEVQRRLALVVGGHSLRLVRPEHLHLTLVFIGEVQEARTRVLTEQMAAPLQQVGFEMVFEQAGVFPAHGAPRILWLGVSTGSESAIALQREIVGRLEAVGVQAEERPFTPHLTLARWRQSRPSDRRRVLAERIGRTARVIVREVTLYQSRLSPAGPTYVALCRTPLTEITAGSIVVPADHE